MAQTATPIEIFRAGSHRTAAGEMLAFAAADLAATADGYDPALHEAPIVVGHPAQDAPAYGWVRGLQLVDGRLVAQADQVDSAFAEMVRKGRFKHVSAAFYRPDQEGNPKPGTWYLRHVGFLGAQPPAVKGLKPAAFAEGVAFAEFSSPWAMTTVARLFGRMRDFIIGQFGQERADTVLPADDIDQLRSMAAMEAAEDMATELSTSPTYSEEGNVPDNTEAAAALAAREAAVAEREARLVAREREARAADDAAFLEGLIRDGRLVPAQRDQVATFMAQLDAATPVAFAEGDSATPHARFRALLQAAPKVVTFGEVAGGDGPQADEAPDPVEISRQATEFMEAESRAGRSISHPAAVAHVMAQRAEKGI